LNDVKVIDLKPKSPEGGAMVLGCLEVEAIRSIISSEQEINKLMAQLNERRSMVMAEITSAHGCPSNAMINVSNIETGDATWALPEKAQRE